MRAHNGCPHLNQNCVMNYIIINMKKQMKMHHLTLH